MVARFSGPLYAGERGDADVRFPLDSWEQAQRDLANVEPIVRELSNQYQLEMLGNKEGRYPWPSRGVLERRSLARREVRISIHAQFFDDFQMMYVLEETRIPAFADFLNRRRVYTVLSRYTPSELAQHDRIRSEFKGALERR